MQLMRSMRKSQRGDTIVEVMISLAVLGLAVGVGYSIATRSLLNTRAAQENSEATVILQQQVESLRYIAPVVSTNLMTHEPFCIGDVDPDSPDSSVYDTDDDHCTGGLYHIEISAKDDSGSGKYFEVKVTWDDVLGAGQDQATMSYRPFTR